jgi:4-hydroxy-tetrahydrodipicolinate synthase
MERFTGLWIPLVTPFADGQLDLPAAQSLVDRFAEAGCTGIVVCGTTGESGALSDEEKDVLLSAVLEAAAGRLDVAMGVCGSATRAVCDEVRRWSARPIDALLISAPYYVRPSQEGIALHFEAVARSTDKPIMLYNIPYRTGVNIAVETICQLAANPQFVAIKESGSGNVDQLFDLIARTPLKVLSGEDHMIFLTACLGGHGAIAAAAHVRPELYVRVLRLVESGRVAEARALFAQLTPWIRLLFSEPNPGPIKTALALQGLVRDELRLPMRAATPGCRTQIEAALARVLDLE